MKIPQILRSLLLLLIIYITLPHNVQAVSLPRNCYYLYKNGQQVNNDSFLFACTSTSKSKRVCRNGYCCCDIENTEVKFYDTGLENVPTYNEWMESCQTEYAQKAKFCTLIEYTKIFGTSDLQEKNTPTFGIWSEECRKKQGIQVQDCNFVSYIASLEKSVKSTLSISTSSNTGSTTDKYYKVNLDSGKIAAGIKVGATRVLSYTEILLIVLATLAISVFLLVLVSKRRNLKN